MSRYSAKCGEVGGQRRSVAVAAFLLCMQLAAVTLVHSSQVEQTLYHRLVNGPNSNGRQLRPVKSHVQPVRVGLQVSIVDIIGIDENRNQVTVKLWLSLRWKDEYLTWNPMQYDGVKRLNMATGPDAKIWTPDIVMFSALNSGSTPTVHTDAVVTSDGIVSWVYPVIYTVSSQHEFRTNSWSSTFRFGSWSYDAARLDLQPDIDITEDNTVPGSSDNSLSIRMDTRNFMQTDHWSILDARGRLEATIYRCCPDEPYSSITYLVKLRKKSSTSLLGRRKA